MMGAGEMESPAWQEQDRLLQPSLDWSPWLARVVGGFAFVCKVQLDVAKSFLSYLKGRPMPA